MKKVFLLWIAACLSVVASAQKVYFIYLQTEDQAPFYVRIGDKIHSSAASGYLIIPNLVDTTYYLAVGFAKSTDPETKFSVAVNQNDRGFLIKKFDDGLALFDFEELALVKSNAAPKDNTVYETKTDAFSNLLSKAAGDPSIVKVPVAKKEEVAKPKTEPEKKEEVVAKTETNPIESPASQSNAGTTQTDTTSTAKANPEAGVPKTESKTDTTVAANVKPVETFAKNETLADTTSALSGATTQQVPKEITTVLQTVQKEEPQVQPVAYKPSVVTRRSESSTTEGFGLVYFDKSSEATDTIRILIPSSKIKLTNETEAVSSPAVETTAMKEPGTPVTEVKKTETDSTAKQTVSATTETSGKENATPKKSETYSACNSSASDKDFLKLRKKMAAKENDDEMITEAKKEFKNKCYTVEQIRNLSTLFLTSAAKYQFFDVAYQHVSDGSNFASLASEIKDEYYLKRFKALIGE